MWRLNPDVWGRIFKEEAANSAALLCPQSTWPAAPGAAIASHIQTFWQHVPNSEAERILQSMRSSSLITREPDEDAAYIRWQARGFIYTWAKHARRVRNKNADLSWWASQMLRKLSEILPEIFEVPNDK